jgi:hypothetical protein
MHCSSFFIQTIPIDQFLSSTVGGITMFAGDILVYRCRTSKWGVSGGLDEVLDVFGCAQDGLLDTPDVKKGEEWPRCSPQQDSEEKNRNTFGTLLTVTFFAFFLVIIMAAEMMLDKFDRRISDRFKMIDYREEDNQKKIVSRNNFLIGVTLPVVISKCGFLVFFLQKGSSLFDPKNYGCRLPQIYCYLKFKLNSNDHA